MSDVSAKRVADFILDVGTYLLASGAHCGRLKSNLSRMAIAWGYDIDLNPSFTGLSVTVKGLIDTSDVITLFKTAPPHKVHFSVLTDVSRLSWEVYDNRHGIAWAEEVFRHIKSKKTYNTLTASIAVGFSCAGLCFFSFGDIYNALVAFVGAFVGLLVNTWFLSKNFNQMLCVVVAAFVTTLITGIGSIYNIGAFPEAAMATSVLYLIPSVPLINSVIDLIEGCLSSSINRALFAGSIIISMVTGMTLCIILLGIDNLN